jgi:superoxide dismutase, Cu-Zn family
MRPNLKTASLAAAAALGLALMGAGCQQHNKQPAASPDSQKVADKSATMPPMNAADMGPDVKEAIAVLHGTKGNEKVQGTVKFSEAPGADHPGVKIVAHVEGLAPNSEHGFHIHEFGDCSAPDAMSAGGHFNPTGGKHGPPGAQSHVGDMGNLKADASGMAHLEVTVPHASITGKTGVLGRGVIVHANVDDLKTQPTGNAGGRIACGVVGAAQVKK